MVVTNFITFLSYLSICCTLFYLARRTGRVIARDWRYFIIGFALFIVACGSTHLLEVITTWSPIFWVDAWTNILTALLSGYVAMNLIRRASAIAFGIDDYAARLANAEHEKRQMEASLLTAQKLEDWSRMSAVVAHEIGNPLETIQNILHLIATTDDITPELAGLTRMANDEVGRVITITRSTLGFFRQTVQPEHIDLGVAVESVRYLLDSLLRGGGIELVAQSSGDVAVEAFPGETRQVLLNLIRNACEASTAPGAKVHVTLTGQPHGVEIVIEDQGGGIDPQFLPDLFQFGRSTKGERGNGMGLWTVRQIVAKHGGEISVASTPGEGTRFTLWWPRTFHHEAAVHLTARSA
jgi:signal transduction histidine kinase